MITDLDTGKNEGQAKFIRLLEICGCFELWDVEFLDCEGKIWPRLIKSNNENNRT